MQVPQAAHDRLPDPVPESETRDAEAIRGSMTLREVAESTGIPLQHLTA
jgi:hypothetical protein